MKKYFLILVLIFLGCHYNIDKFKVKNNSNHKICYDVMIKSKLDNDYYFISSGGTVNPNESHSPNVRNTILYSLETESKDKVLYVVYFNEKDRDFIYNQKKIILSDKFKIDKYSLKELDSLKWVVKYE